MTDSVDVGDKSIVQKYEWRMTRTYYSNAQWQCFEITTKKLLGTIEASVINLGCYVAECGPDRESFVDLDAAKQWLEKHAEWRERRRRFVGG